MFKLTVREIEEIIRISIEIAQSPELEPVEASKRAVQELLGLDGLFKITEA